MELILLVFPLGYILKLLEDFSKMPVLPMQNMVIEMNYG